MECFLLLKAELNSSDDTFQSRTMFDKHHSVARQFECFNRKKKESIVEHLTKNSIFESTLSGININARKIPPESLYLLVIQHKNNIFFCKWQEIV